VEHDEASEVSTASTSGSNHPQLISRVSKPYWKPSLMRLIKLNSPEWPYALLGSIGAMMAGWKTPLAALGMGDILVSFYSFRESYIKLQVRKICLLFTGAIPVTIIVFLMQNYFFEVMGERLTIRVREKMLSCELVSATTCTIFSLLHAMMISGLYDSKGQFSFEVFYGGPPVSKSTNEKVSVVWHLGITARE